MPKEKHVSPFGKKFCHRCRTGGHLAAGCTRMHTSKGYLVESNPKTRVPAGNRTLRELSKVPSVFGDVKLIEMTERNIDKIETCTSGIYEISFENSLEEVQKRKGKQRDVIPVYLGMSNDVCERLKDHFHGKRMLDGDLRTSNIELLTLDCKKRNRPLYFRWIPCESREEAKKMESKLLERYDYAWNLDENGKTKWFIY